MMQCQEVPQDCLTSRGSQSAVCCAVTHNSCCILICRSQKVHYTSILRGLVEKPLAAVCSLQSSTVGLAAPCNLKRKADQPAFFALVCTDLGTAVATSVKASVVERVLQSYAACAIQLAELVKWREARGHSGDGASEVETLQKGSKVLHARGIAAQAAATKDVLAAKWVPP